MPFFSKRTAANILFDSFNAFAKAFNFGYSAGRLPETILHLAGSFETNTPRIAVTLTTTAVGCVVQMFDGSEHRQKYLHYFDNSTIALTTFNMAQFAGLTLVAEVTKTNGVMNLSKLTYGVVSGLSLFVGASVGFERTSSKTLKEVRAQKNRNDIEDAVAQHHEPLMDQKTIDNLRVSSTNLPVVPNQYDTRSASRKNVDSLLTGTQWMVAMLGLVEGLTSTFHVNHLLASRIAKYVLGIMTGLAGGAMERTARRRETVDMVFNGLVSLALALQMTLYHRDEGEEMSDDLRISEMVVYGVLMSAQFVRSCFREAARQQQFPDASSMFVDTKVVKDVAARRDQEALDAHDAATSRILSTGPASINAGDGDFVEQEMGTPKEGGGFKFYPWGRRDR